MREKMDLSKEIERGENVTMIKECGLEGKIKKNAQTGQSF